MTYDEYLKSHVKYAHGTKCFVDGCPNEGLYEMGDSRYYAPSCEEHAGMKSRYNCDKDIPDRVCPWYTSEPDSYKKMQEAVDLFTAVKTHMQHSENNGVKNDIGEN